MPPLIRSLRLKNFLSFGPEGTEVELRGLNVLIGANASGKSNLISALRVLQAAPRELVPLFSRGGGIREWIWKGPRSEVDFPCIATDLDGPEQLRYKLEFTEENGRLHILDERVWDLQPKSPGPPAPRLVQFRHPTGGLRGEPVPGNDDMVNLQPAEQQFDYKSHVSLLAQLRGPAYKEFEYIATAFQSIAIYDDWNFAVGSLIRRAQPADMMGGFLLEDGSNLALALQEFPFLGVERQLSELLEAANPAYRRVVVKNVQGTIGTYVEEAAGIFTPAPRLSRGTLQLLCLAAVLLHPQPPPVVCIEEPEIGLHPDMMTTLAKLLRDASTRTQVIVTTHSDILVDALSDTPESVLVCERDEKGTSIRRLNPQLLKNWLDNYGLGTLWREGEIGGNRW